MFSDRKDAGKLLAGRLKAYCGQKDVIVLALPRGGVVIGSEIAQAVGAPLDVLIVRKLGHPAESELAIGAVAETGAVILNRPIISAYGVADDYVQTEIARQKQEISRRAVLYRAGGGLPRLEEKTVILVDDGVATGATMKAAIQALQQLGIAKLVVALPVSPPETAAELRNLADAFICLETPFNFLAVGAHYRNFNQVTDEEVIEILQRAAAEAA